MNGGGRRLCPLPISSLRPVPAACRWACRPTTHAAPPQPAVSKAHTLTIYMDDGRICRIFRVPVGCLDPLGSWQGQGYTIAYIRGPAEVNRVQSEPRPGVRVRRHLWDGGPRATTATATRGPRRRTRPPRASTAHALPYLPPPPRDSSPYGAMRHGGPCQPRAVWDRTPWSVVRGPPL